MYKLRKIVCLIISGSYSFVMDGTNITCFMQQTVLLVDGLVAVVLPFLVAGGLFRLQTE